MCKLHIYMQNVSNKTISYLSGRARLDKGYNAGSAPFIIRDVDPGEIGSDEITYDTPCGDRPSIQIREISRCESGAHTFNCADYAATRGLFDEEDRLPTKIVLTE